MSKSKISHYTASNSANQNDRIEHDLQQLGLEGMLASFIRLAEVNIANHGTPKDYLELLLEKQRIYKENARIQSWIQQARFGKIKTLATFRFKEQPTINQQQIYDLASGTFIDEKKNIIFLGQAGVGKTHLAKGVGVEVIYKGYDVKFVELKTLIQDLTFKFKDVDSQRRLLISLLRPKLLILDDIKYFETTSTIRDFLYKLFSQRYEEKSTMFTSNKDFSEWKRLFGEDAEAILDRILEYERLVLIKIEGESYRIKNKLQTNRLIAAMN